MELTYHFIFTQGWIIIIIYHLQGKVSTICYWFVFQDVESTYYLGICYENGLGVEKDDGKALKLYHKAAKQGNAAALYNLAVFYEDGFAGWWLFGFIKISRSCHNKNKIHSGHSYSVFYSLVQLIVININIIR